MKWLASCLGLCVLFFACTNTAAGALCEKCRGRMYTQDIGECTHCGGYTTSGAFKLCPKCSAALKRCEHCLTALGPAAMPPRPKPPKRPPVVPPAAQPQKPEPIKLDKSRTYLWQQWKYDFQITAPGTRSEGRWGKLYYAGRELPAAEVNDHYETPWGKLYWVGRPQVRWGDHGWMPRPNPASDRQGRLLPSPAAAASAFSYSMAHNGKSVEVPLGAVLTIRLEGNITTGYSWQPAELEGEALQSLGKPEYVQRPRAPGMVGVGGVFVFKLKAIKPGKALVKTVYVRPWEKGKPPERTFSLTVVVKPRQPPAGHPEPGEPAA